MSTTRHAPDPTHVRETLCGTPLSGLAATELHRLAALGDSISCARCRTIINMATRCVSPHHYVLARLP